MLDLPDEDAVVILEPVEEDLPAVVVKADVSNGTSLHQVVYLGTKNNILSVC